MLKSIQQFVRQFPSTTAFSIRNCSTEIVRPKADVQPPKYDKLYRKIEIEWRGHDPAVLKSYALFVQNVCNLLEIEKSPVKEEPYQRWLMWANKSKFAKKKYKYHYEARTYIQHMWVQYLTGSTASTFLEYIQRNIPEGVGMKVTFTEICPVPEAIAEVDRSGNDGKEEENKNNE